MGAETLFILSIAGSDPLSGAGCQADVKVGYALGAYVLTVVTAVTVQNTQGVHQVVAMSGDLVKAQLEKILDDFRPQVIKIGLLPNIKILKTVLSTLAEVNIPLILDPIFAPTKGEAFMDTQDIMILRDYLPRIQVLTPNIREAMQILEIDLYPKTQQDVINLAKGLVALGVEHIVLKGGHLSGEWCIDYYASEKEINFVQSLRLGIDNRHGTGCALAMALAVYLAKDKKNVYQALRLAKKYQQNILQASIKSKLGCSYGLLAH